MHMAVGSEEDTVGGVMDIRLVKFRSRKVSSSGRDRKTEGIRGDQRNVGWLEQRATMPRKEALAQSQTLIC
jgi:hypothetical protein